jgi:hypothetical protein
VFLAEYRENATSLQAPIRFASITRQGKLNSEFIVTDFSILHAGGAVIIQISN